MTTSSRLYVLFADDPEMQAIERLLVAAGERYAYAAGPDGKRVHPGNAYQATGVTFPEGSRGFDLTPDRIYLVEGAFAADRQPCRVGGWVELATPGTAYTFGTGADAWGPIPQDRADGLITEGLATAEAIPVTVIDHHRPGDPGHGRPPECFLAGSSIGQVMAAMLKSGLAYGAICGSPGVQMPHGAQYFSAGVFHDISGTWYLMDGAGHGAPVPREIVLAAAADHCLEAAYRGRCPGVDPDVLMRWRAESRAAFQKRPVEAVLADIDLARGLLRSPEYKTADGIADFRRCVASATHIPELPEAACREGIPFLANIQDRDGRWKVVLQAAPADIVRRFLAGEIVPGLHDMYGSPERGLAGGYLAPKE